MGVELVHTHIILRIEAKNPPTEPFTKRMERKISRQNSN